MRISLMSICNAFIIFTVNRISASCYFVYVPLEKQAAARIFNTGGCYEQRNFGSYSS